ncbi:MAG: LA2681 family HEPN domain-containing protein [Candidatus Competibacter sp.]
MDDASLDDLARLIDAAMDASDIDAIRRYLRRLEDISKRNLTKIAQAQVGFFKANCYSTLRQLQNRHQSWDWDDPDLENEIYHLRLARNFLSEIPIESDRTDLRFRVSTNLANAFNHVGRFSEAIDLWSEVLEEFPEYAMAVGNRGFALSWYARYLYDPGHQELFLNESYRSIKLALELGVEEHAASGMQQWMEHLLELYDWESFQFQRKYESRGRSKREKAYRTWCLDHKLFLNPLNDLWKEDIAANDVFTFPSIIVKLENSRRGSPPEVYGIYNQLKQEYVSTRYMLFDAIAESEEKVHFSDKKVKLYDMLDYREYRLWIEKAKMAFMSAYAIFDKIAFLVNEYWELGQSARRINFKSCWFKNGKTSDGFVAAFESSENWPLRGLYWISKEFIGEKERESPLQPDAWHISEIRNHIAHKYLKVFDHILVDTKQWRNASGHELEYPISDQELIKQTLKLLSLVRSALIYVSLAVYDEESRKRAKIGDGLLGDLQLFEVDDKYRL